MGRKACESKCNKYNSAQFQTLISLNFMLTSTKTRAKYRL